MSMKEFLIKNKDMMGLVSFEELGEFFWERGGQLYYIRCREKSFYKGLKQAEYEIKTSAEDVFGTRILQAQDFLDCVACLGEEKVKKLIKEMK